MTLEAKDDSTSLIGATELLLELLLELLFDPLTVVVCSLETPELRSVLAMSTEEAVLAILLCCALSRTIGGPLFVLLVRLGFRKYIKLVMTGHTKSHPKQI